MVCGRRAGAAIAGDVGARGAGSSGLKSMALKATVYVPMPVLYRKFTVKVPVSNPSLAPLMELVALMEPPGSTITFGLGVGVALPMSVPFTSDPSVRLPE